MLTEATINKALVEAGLPTELESIGKLFSFSWTDEDENNQPRRIVGAISGLNYAQLSTYYEQKRLWGPVVIQVLSQALQIDSDPLQLGFTQKVIKNRQHFDYLDPGWEICSSHGRKSTGKFQILR